jgi:hypothetical protein
VLGLKGHYEHYLQHYLATLGEKELRAVQRMYHAIVGDADAEMLICLYKSWVSLVLVKEGDDWVIWEMPEEHSHDMEEQGWSEFRVNGILVETVENEYPALVKATFKDKLGRRWVGTSAIGSGSGFDWFDPEEE